MITSAKLSTQIALSSSITPDLSYLSESATITDTKAVSTGTLWSDSRTIPTLGSDTINLTALVDSYGTTRDIGNARVLIVENTSTSGSIKLSTTSAITGSTSHTVSSGLSSTYVSVTGATFVSGSVTPQIIIPAGGSYSLVMDTGWVYLPEVTLTSITTGSTYDLIAIGSASGSVKITFSDCTGVSGQTDPGMSFGITVAGVEYRFYVIWGGATEPTRIANTGYSYGVPEASGSPWLASEEGIQAVNDCFAYAMTEFTSSYDEDHNPIITPVSGRIESARAIGDFTHIEYI